ncbi:trehalase [Cimex lectularius]|uniref:Trehalase n=1 Tax=Cimex lectularius TaxID=79782 RepID=A0A8I6RA99_CIMLE|nr:trehalase [Cimex lectularius]XP_024081621.1 trehalase [Cimex lectularius]
MKWPVPREAMKTVFFLLITAAAYASNGPPCENDIYCYGDILHTVQINEIFKDSKSFVDMKIKTSPEEVKSNFRKLMEATKGVPPVEDIKKYVNDNFEPPGSEFVEWSPADWKEYPRFLDTVNDADLRKWGFDLNQIWKSLGRKITENVRENSQLYSIIYLPYPFIIPGGRFREVYYWDSYWVIRGLLESEMYSTVRGMLSNFVHLIKTVGLIPNGGRIYYVNRSQPPLFIPMVETYFATTKDLTFIKEHIGEMEKEFDFWMTNRTVRFEKDGVVYKMATYNDFSDGPRPESYKEDYNLAKSIQDEDDKNKFYSHLKACAETGWDFSTRWFVTNGTDDGSLLDSKAKSIVPVDLNSILYKNADILADFHHILGNWDKEAQYRKIAAEWLTAVTKVLWNEQTGAWLDYDIKNGLKRDFFYPTNVAPLWTNCYEPEKKDYYVSRVVKYLKKIDYPGGIPTTLKHSGEQWDYPNAWPPLQHMVITGLEQTGDKEAQELAFSLAEKWVLNNYKAFNDSGHMYEKYDSVVVGKGGGGGEYEVQLGFGWSNGVIMDLLSMYGHRLSASPEEAKAGAVSLALSTAHIAPLITLVLAQTTLAAGCVAAILYAKKILPRPTGYLYTRIPD